ncbi:type I methionyl aminopeptidase [Microbacterium sp. MPKO10]|uniref:type I methionyl aminopeptidase n=1 Tax=Microbacterium sp. MPKO10 TaxID=2989818 RepID=UPI00223630C1|nr:type I methionyl aminopeptidase [Microbacterium sp. MPKO10]MCW4457566.1 type I methionyl aminopeptidase [Microbacterium sp. MPKO10]
MRPLRRSIYKSPAQLRLMREPGLLTARALAAACDAVRPGVTTAEIDSVAESVIVAGGGKPNFKMERGYHHTLCVSVNDEVVHGIPGDRVIEPGDIVSIDCGADVGGWNGDSAATVVVPDPERPDVVAAREKLSAATEGSLWAGIARLATATHLNEIGDAVQSFIEANPAADGSAYGIIEDYIGHGIGRSMHEEPPVFNYRVPMQGPAVKNGLVVAIEPMVVEASPDTEVQSDDWTVVTTDGGAAAHWEHSIAVHAGGIWVLTAEDGGAAGLAPFGITPAPIA